MSTHILYFSAHGKVLNSELFDPVQSSSNSNTEQIESGVSSPAASNGKRVGKSSSRLRSRSDLELSDEACRTVSFIDLAGSSKYLKTTLHGIVGHRPDWLCLCVSASNRCNGSLLSSITAEHLGLAFALAKPLLVVVTKTDAVSAEVVEALVASLVRLLSKPLERQAVLVESLVQIKLLHSCTPRRQPQQHDGETTSVTTTTTTTTTATTTATVVPIFQVSNVTGAGLDLLRSYLFQLPQHTKCWVDARARHTEVRIVGSFVKSNATTAAAGNGNSKEVNSTGSGAALPDSSSSSSSVTVLSGQVLSGVVSLGDALLVGPLGAEGAFIPVTVASLRVNNVAVKKALAGQLTTLVVDEQTSSPQTPTQAAVSLQSTPSGAGTGTGTGTEKGASSILAAAEVMMSPRSTSSLSSYATAPAGNDCSSNNLATSPDSSSKPMGPGQEGECGIVDNSTSVSNSSRSGSPDTESKDSSKDMDSVTTAVAANSSSSKGKMTMPPSSSLQQLLLSQYQLGLPGQVLLSPRMHGARPVAYWEFDAEFLCLFHPGKVRVSYEPVVHIGGVVQSARLLAIRKLNNNNNNSPSNKSRSGSSCSSDLEKPPDRGVDDDDVFLVSESNEP